MKVRYIKEGYGHKAGTAISVDTQLGKKLIERGICEQIQAVISEVPTSVYDIEDLSYTDMLSLAKSLQLPLKDTKKATVIEAFKSYEAAKTT